MCRLMKAFIFCYKILQNWLQGVTLKYSIFLIILCSQPILISFLKGVLKSGVWKTATSHPPVEMTFSISMIYDKYI